ncbi:MAG: DUF4388 domain-containing protein [Longimicrobiales bacterium]
MAIEGPLQDIGIHDVFQLLDLARKSGRLTVRSSARDNEGTVYFESGAVVHATMRDNPHTLGALLKKAGKVSERELDRAMGTQRTDMRRLGEILVAQGSVTRREVERYMRQQIESVVFDLVSWNAGSFTFADGVDDLVQMDAAIRVSIESLLMEGARRIDEWSRMGDRIPGAEVVPRLAQQRHDAGAFIDLRPAEWEVLALIDGSHSLREIAAELAVSEFEVAKTVYGMLSTELIEVSSGILEVAA